MEKRYQVFVSSTFRDLQDERQEVMQALLELDCIPAGMELFPAANEDQWTLIKRVIDHSDYYLVVIGGRYGSIGPDGISYTEMEYRYALDQDKPVIPFLHKDPGTLAANRTEENEEGKRKLAEFRALAQKKVVRYWSNPSDLGSQVSRSLVRLIKDHPAIGWVRADRVPDESTAEEILQLRKQADELKEQLRAARTKAPEGAEGLAHGDDEFEMSFTFTADRPEDIYQEPETCTGKVKASWDELFAAVAPIMMSEASETRLRQTLDAFVQDSVADELAKKKEFKGYNLSEFTLSTTDFHTMKIQLNALGLITKSPRSHSLKDVNTYWSLTPYGEATMMRLRAIRKP